MIKIDVIDDYDIKILRAFNSLTNGKEKDLSSWEPMKKIFRDGREKENMKVKRRIQKMCDLGLFNIYEDSESIRWVMNKKNVNFKSVKFPDKRCNAILLRIRDRWEIHQL